MGWHAWAVIAAGVILQRYVLDRDSALVLSAIAGMPLLQQRLAFRRCSSVNALRDPACLLSPAVPGSHLHGAVPSAGS